MLPVAAPAPPRSGVRAGRLDPLRSRPQDLDRVRPGEGSAGILGDSSAHPFTRQRVPHEDHSPAGYVADASDAVTAVGDRADLEFEQLAQRAESVIESR